MYFLCIIKSADEMCFETTELVINKIVEIGKKLGYFSTHLMFVLEENGNKWLFVQDHVFNKILETLCKDKSLSAYA